MKLIFKTVFFLLCVNVATAQVPIGAPTVNAPSSWYKIGWLQGENGLINANKDTGVYVPRFGGTMVYRPIDGKLYYYDSVSKAWQKISIGSDVPINIATASLTATGDWTQNWNSKQWKFQNISEVGLFSTQPVSGTTYRQTNYGTQSSMGWQFESYLYDSTTSTIDKINKIGIGSLGGGDEGVVLQTSDIFGAGAVLSVIGSGTPRVQVDSLLVVAGKLRIGSLSTGTGSDTVLVRDASTGEIKGVAASSFSTAINNTNTGSGFRLLRDPSLQTLRTIYNSNTVLWDSVSNVNGLTAKVDTSVIATQYDLSQIGDPNLQQVTDVGHTTTNPIVADSLRARSIDATSDLYTPIRNMLDSVTNMRSRGDIWYDTVSNSLYYRTRDVNNVGIWSPIASLSNSLIPNRPNMRIVAGVIRANLNATNDTLIWGPIVDVKHDSIFFTSVNGNVDNRITVKYPHVSKVIAFSAWPDETLAALGVTCGTSVEVDSASIFVYVDGGTMSGFLRGTGGVWVKSTNINAWQITDSANRIWINYGPTSTSVNNFNADYNGLIATYTGTNGNYIINKIVGTPVASGAYGTSIQLTDAYGNPVTTKDAGDIITLQSNYRNYYRPSTLLNGANDFPASIFANGLANIWFIGILEL